MRQLIYLKNWLIPKNDLISKHALKRVALYTERRKLSGYDTYLARYAERYKDDKVSEYFLWLLAKKYLRSKNFTMSRKYLEKSISLFPSGKYSDRVRFWLYKIYKIDGKSDEARKFEMELIVKNSNSSYTWALIDKVSRKYSIVSLKKGFNASLADNKKLEVLYFHALLFAKEKSFEKRYKRLEEISSSGLIDDYLELDNYINNMDLSSRYEKLLMDIEKYFKIGNIEAIKREIKILPDENEINQDRNLAMSHYGQKYNNYYLSAVYTVKLLKLLDLKENVPVHSKDIINRLFPLSYRDYVKNRSKKFKIDHRMVYSVIKAESMYNHVAVSSAGAVGLLQIMPNTAKGIAKNLKISTYDLKDPYTSINFGVKYLSWLNRMFKGNFEEMMGGYNAGAGNIIKWKKKFDYSDSDLFVELIPYEETRYYILRTRRFLILYKLIYN